MPLSLAPLWKLDDALFDYVFQPLVNRFPAVSLSEMSRFFMMGVCAVQVAEPMIMWRQQTLTAADATFDGFLLAAYMFTYWIIGGRDIARDGARNPIRGLFPSFLFRLICLFGIGVSVWGLYFGHILVADVSFVIKSVLYTASLYVSHCDKPPPRQQRRAAPDPLARATS